MCSVKRAKVKLLNFKNCLSHFGPALTKDVFQIMIKKLPKTTQKRPKNYSKSTQIPYKNEPKTIQKQPKNEPKT